MTARTRATSCSTVTSSPWRRPRTCTARWSPGSQRYQADLAVTCAGLTGQQFVAEPLLIVEVLSPSTAATDRERKLPDYRAIPSLRDILVVSSSEPRVEHYRREPDGWRIHDVRGQGTLHPEAFDVTLDLAELYAGVLTESATNRGIRLTGRIRA